MTRLSVSDNGFFPSAWGPLLWNFMHIISMNYPCNPTPANKKQYRDFLVSLKNVLPCKLCRKHYTANISSGPTRLSREHFASRESLFEFMYNLHKKVSADVAKSKRMKPKRTPSRESVARRLERLRYAKGKKRVRCSVVFIYKGHT
jgi:hypothetical protein